MANDVSTFEGINTVFPVSAYDPLNADSLIFVFNWGDGSQEQVLVPRISSQRYYYEFQKTYEFPGTYLAVVSAYRPVGIASSSPKQLALFNVTVESLTANDPLPRLKVMNAANFVGYNMFTLTIDDDGVLRGWQNRQVSIPVSFNGTVLGFLSASYSPAVSGTIGISLTANQVSNLNWPTNTNLFIEVLEKDNNTNPYTITSLFKGYLYIYETAEYSAIFI